MLFILLGDLLAPWPLVPRVMLLTMLVVVIMTWVVAPQLTRGLKPWLHSHHKQD
jgi:antibiotic biosynthesis monooxygenase (ABM) superfamily enzyme